jgi:endonuclease V-like protein UPF0215 family
LKRIVITERQREILTKFELNEVNDYELMIRKIVDDLNLNYEPVVGTYRKGGEYFEKPIVKIKVDGQTTTPKGLLDYLKYKNKSVSEILLKQIIIDWVNGDIDNYTLTKNVGLT